jgi:hypothetical protein
MAYEITHRKELTIHFAGSIFVSACLSFVIFFGCWGIGIAWTWEFPEYDIRRSACILHAIGVILCVYDYGLGATTLQGKMLNTLTIVATIPVPSLLLYV